MAKKFSCLIVFLISLVFLVKVYGVDEVRVVVLPFDIHAKEYMSYLRSDIADGIKKNLKNFNATIIEPKYTSDKKITEGYVRTVALQNEADYIIWGSFSRLGEGFSIDVKMIKTSSSDPPVLLFSQGKGIENLSGAVGKISNDISSKIFKHEKVASIKVIGNNRIEAEAILRAIKTKSGDIFSSDKLSQDLKAIYAMGYFDDVHIESENISEGKKLIIVIKEKPTIHLISFKGNRVFKSDELMEQLTIKTGSIFNIKQINSNLQRIENHYKEKNYQNIKVTYGMHPLENNQVDLEFITEEGQKIRIKEIKFVGNKFYSTKKLKKQIKTKEKGFFFWLTSSGELNVENLNTDISKIAGFYQTNGFIDSKISEPQIEYRDNWIYITIKIDEGQQFKVGKVDIEGSLLKPKDDLLKQIKITKENFLNRNVIQDDIILLTDAYSDEGYAYADISPRIDKDTAKLTANITYVIDKGKKIYIEKIIISGNTKTRDKVIRRELPVYEQDFFSGHKLKRGVRNLNRLDYFQDVKVDTVKGSSDDKMLIKLDVTEKPTGAFSFGGGYSSVEHLFATASISQRNLFGLGETLQLKAMIGGITTQYNLSFTEPWLFDIPLSGGVDLYNWKTNYDTYDKDAVGGGFRLSYPIFDYTRAYFSYSYEIDDLTNIADDAPISIKELEGTNVASTVTTTISYDSRDKMFNPTEGSEHSATVQYAGLGGDIAYTKYIAETGWYVPLFWDTVGFLHGRTGFVRENEGGKLPAYERFYLGGINTLRGFEWQGISPEDKDGIKIGGNKFVQFNTEYIFPLIKKAGLVGLVFYDSGNSWDNHESISLSSLRESAGFGFRWYSPIGPIRLENGYILNPKPGESSGGKWEFTMGAAF